MAAKRLPVTVEIQWVEPTPERVAKVMEFWSWMDERIQKRKEANQGIEVDFNHS